MKQKIDSPVQLHADHRRWKSKLSMWRDEIELWQQEYSGSLTALEFAAEILRNQSKAIKEHMQAIEEIESSVQYHEKNLSEELKGQGDGDSDLAEILNERHAKRQSDFDRQRLLHENLKRRVHIAVSQISAMLTAISSKNSTKQTT